MLDGDASTGGLVPTPGAEVCTAESGSHCCHLIVGSDRVDVEAEVGKGHMPASDDGFELLWVGESTCTADVEGELVGKKRCDAGEIPTVPPQFEHHPGDFARTHEATISVDVSTEREGAGHEAWLPPKVS